MNYKDVELTDGRTVRVYRPPTRRIIDIVEKQHPRPQPPTVTETTGPGKEIVMRIDDDPAYLAELEQWDELVREKTDEMGSLFMFKDVTPPDDWNLETEVGDEVRYFDPDWEPREGRIGRKLDYIQWNILGDVVDGMNVFDALREMSGIDLEGVASNEASFRGQVEGKAAE